MLGSFLPLKSHVTNSKSDSGFVSAFKISFSRCLPSQRLSPAESSIPPFDSSLFLLERHKQLHGATNLPIEGRSLLSGLSLPAKMHLSLARWDARRVALPALPAVGREGSAGPAPEPFGALPGPLSFLVRDCLAPKLGRVPTSRRP